MNNEELAIKVHQIEEQARLSLEERPEALTRARQRIIIALAKLVRSELEDRTIPGAPPAGAPRR